MKENYEERKGQYGKDSTILIQKIRREKVKRKDWKVLDNSKFYL
jgi:hypothetical protein